MVALVGMFSNLSLVYEEQEKSMITQEILAISQRIQETIAPQKIYFLAPMKSRFYKKVYYFLYCLVRGNYPGTMDSSK